MDHDESEPAESRKMLTPSRTPVELAEAVRCAVIEALLEAYEDAGVRGLCADGRLEAAVGAARGLDLAAMIESSDPYRGNMSSRDLG